MRPRVYLAPLHVPDLVNKTIWPKVREATAPLIDFFRRNTKHTKKTVAYQKRDQKQQLLPLSQGDSRDAPFSRTV